jgi:hypothetical protein
MLSAKAGINLLFVKGAYYPMTQTFLAQSNMHYFTSAMMCSGVGAWRVIELSAK